MPSVISCLRKGFLTYLFPLLCLALAMRVWLAAEYPGDLRPDEVFQYLEPAHYLAFGTWVKTWEWDAGIRSWLVPSLIAGMFHLAALLHVQNMVLFVRILFAVMSLLPVALFTWAGWQWRQGQGALLFGLVAALWPDMINAGIRPLGECFGGNLLVSGVLLAFIVLQLGGGITGARRSLLLGCAAFLLGCAAAVRFQFMPAVAAAMLYILIKATPRERVIMCIACTVPVGVLGVLDKITLGQYFQSVWKNYFINISMGVANSFGKRSLLYFVKKYAVRWGVLAVPVLFLSLRGWRYCRFPLLVSLFIILYHSCISHKEMSFIYPAVPLFVFAACFALGEMSGFCKGRVTVLVGALCLGISLWLFSLSSYQPHWQEQSEIAQLQEVAARQPDLRALTFFEPDWRWIQWPNTLGYSGLPQGVAFYLAETRKGLDGLAGRYNYLIADEGVEQALPDMQRVSCTEISYICLYRRGDARDAPRDYQQFSRVVKRGGE